MCNVLLSSGVNLIAAKYVISYLQSNIGLVMYDIFFGYLENFTHCEIQTVLSLDLSDST
jgi:NADH:ubiquinone oxidoreductase subunit 5 (subunit L)/multisubunit Na+/H+ antiporter MnhA subunit